jgi:hypothetical protein
MSLGVLVGRFGGFVREQHSPPPIVGDEASFPESLLHIREAVGHHLIPLTLLARADGDYAELEQEAILNHCIALARDAGIETEEHEVVVLKEYICDYRPTLIQLDPALHRLSRCSHAEVAALVRAAQAVVDADGTRREEETRLLEELLVELNGL